MIDPAFCASAMRSASSGVTISVTTVDGMALPSFACFLVVKGAGRQHLDVAHDRARHAVSSPRCSVTSTSTRVPGTMKPATPMTSLTCTESARMPGGIDGGRPAPASIGASLVSVSGSFACTG